MLFFRFADQWSFWDWLAPNSILQFLFLVLQKLTSLTWKAVKIANEAFVCFITSLEFPIPVIILQLEDSSDPVLITTNLWEGSNCHENAQESSQVHVGHNSSYSYATIT